MGRVARHAPINLAKKLKQIRESLNLSQGEMLKHLGLTEEEGLFRSSISGYELGTRLPSFKVLLAYGKIANIFVEVLIDDDINLPTVIPAKKKSEGIKSKEIIPSQKKN